MARAQIRELTTLRFDGPRFEDHGLEIDILPELIAYKRLLLETTKELWRRNHPSRKQLPKNFEDSISIKFFELGKGSTTIPLMRELRFEDDELPLIIEDELDKAAVIIEASIEAAAQDRPMPENLPRLVLPQFAQFGKTLAEEDSIFARARKRATEVRYTSKVRQRIISFLEPVYEDVIDITGEVRLADLDG